jgi:ribose 5-phosphate isomerase A
VVVAEEPKRVDRLGSLRLLPVEVVRFGWRNTRRQVLGLTREATLRVEPDGTPFLTDEGHHILDCAVPPSGDLGAFSRELKGTTGVVEHGLFLGLAHIALLGRADGTVAILEAPARAG